MPFGPQLHGGGGGQVGVAAFAAPVGRVADGVDHVPDRLHIPTGVMAAEVGRLDLPFLGVVLDDDGAGFGRPGIFTLLSFHAIGWDGNEPEKASDGPMEPDAVLKHAGIAEHPGNDGIQISFAERSADGAIDGVVEHHSISAGRGGMVGG